MSKITDTTDALMRKLIYDAALEYAVKKIMMRFTWLSLWFIHPVFIFIMTKVADVLYTEMARIAAFTLIDVEMGAKKAAYEKATEELKTVIEKKEPTDDEIAKAKEAFRNSLRDLVRRE